MTAGTPPPPILEGVVGSHAYGLANEDSDVDTAAVHVAPTLQFSALTREEWPEESYDGHDPDWVSYEVGKYCWLALQGNPTALDLLFLDNHTTVDANWGQELLNYRQVFLSQKIKDTHLGFAAQQFGRLQRDGKFSNAPDSRREKNARHLLRVLDQGVRLWTTGDMQIRVEDPELLLDQASFIANHPTGPAYATDRINLATGLMEEPTPLPEVADWDAVRSILADIRRDYI